MVRLIACPDRCFVRRTDVHRERAARLLGKFIPILLPPIESRCEQDGMVWEVDPSFVEKTSGGAVHYGCVCEHMIELD